MKLSPHNILQSLGFDIPEDGIEISEHDAFLYIKLLALLGETLSIDAISDEKMFEANMSLAGLVAAHRGEEIVPPTEASVPRLRALCEVVVKDVLKLKHLD